MSFDKIQIFLGWGCHPFLATIGLMSFLFWKENTTPMRESNPRPYVHRPSGEDKKEIKRYSFLSIELLQFAIIYFGVQWVTKFYSNLNVSLTVGIF